MSTQIEQLQQLLDGELDPIHESTLFGELAINGDLRTELREQIAIKNAVQDDRMTLMPPAALTNTLFTGMGFAAPLAGAAAGAAGGSMLMQWLSRLGIPILSAITAATITYTAFDASEPSTGMQRHAPAPAAQEAAQAQAAEPAAAAEPAPSTGTLQRAPSADPALRAENNALRAENARLRSQLASSTEQPIATRTPDDGRRTMDDGRLTSDLEAPTNLLASQVHVTNDVAMTRSADTRFLAPQTLRGFETAYQKYPSLMLQVRGFQLAPTINTAALEQSDWYTNLGIAALYQLNRNHSVGIEIGNESFPMVFEGDRNGQLVRYEQYPTTAWAGLTYRYTGSNFGATSFAPYGQFMVGGSKFGPIGRMSGGVQYTPVGPLSFVFGVETSALAYTFQNNWYLSPKVGLTYGLAVRF